LSAARAPQTPARHPQPRRARGDPAHPSAEPVAGDPQGHGHGSLPAPP
jgi:hypothetical protein